MWGQNSKTAKQSLVLRTIRAVFGSFPLTPDDLGNVLHDQFFEGCLLIG